MQSFCEAAAYPKASSVSTSSSLKTKLPKKTRKCLRTNIVIAGRKRITLDSFEKWYQSQKKYKKVVVSELAPPCDPLEPELICECEQESETTSTEDAVPAEDKKYYTVDEVREMLLLSKRDVYEIVQSGCFKVIQIGRRYLVPKDSFDEWRMQNNT